MGDIFQKTKYLTHKPSNNTVRYGDQKLNGPRIG